MITAASVWTSYYQKSRRKLDNSDTNASGGRERRLSAQELLAALGSAATWRSVPLDMIQDASVVTGLGSGSVAVSSAGGGLSVLVFGPMKPQIARKMADLVLVEPSKARQVSPTGDASFVSRLRQPEELRTTGLLSDKEFEVKKADMLGQL